VGQKVNPVGLRIGIIRDWESKWFAEKDFGTLLLEDVKIREYLKNKLKDSAVSHIDIERAANRVNVTIHTAKPGMVIGKGGAEVEVIRNYIAGLSNKKVHINISEIKSPDLDAILVAEAVALQLEVVFLSVVR
jgi:small subunit ribosomal protein S3